MGERHHDVAAVAADELLGIEQRAVGEIEQALAFTRLIETFDRAGGTQPQHAAIDAKASLQLLRNSMRTG